MVQWVQRNIVEPGKVPLLIALTAFVLTFLITRIITRLIRAGKGPFGNISSGGVHIHHVVPGVVLTVAGGFGAVASGRHGFGAGAFAVVFGIGTGLVLDEFALILHLDDVYWTEAGRKSVEAVVLTAALGGLLLVGFSPFGVNDMSQDELQDRGGVISTVVFNFACSLAVLSKGKAKMAVFSVFIPLLGLVGPCAGGAARFAVGPPVLPAAAEGPGEGGAAGLSPRPPLGGAAPGGGDWLGGKTTAELAQSEERN